MHSKIVNNSIIFYLKHIVFFNIRICIEIKVKIKHKLTIFIVQRSRWKKVIERDAIVNLNAQYEGNFQQNTLQLADA